VPDEQRVAAPDGLVERRPATEDDDVERIARIRIRKDSAAAAQSGTVDSREGRSFKSATVAFRGSPGEGSRKREIEAMSIANTVKF
jgi:hypothetical protein